MSARGRQTVPQLVVALVLLLTAVGCVDGASGGSAAGTPTQTATVLPLATTGFMDACAGEGFNGPVILVAKGDTIYGRFPGGGTVEVYWPNHFTALFDPDFTKILRPDGSTFATAGEDIYPHFDAFTWHEMNVCATGSGIFVYPSLSRNPTG
jgi:hypothetical protein